MKKVILDTSFILECVKLKIDFFEFFELEGFKILIPNKVLFELERIASEKKGGLKIRAEFALKLLKAGNFDCIEIKGKYVDSAIVNYLKENPKDYVATNDEGLRKKIKNKMFLVRAKNNIESI